MDGGILKTKVRVRSAPRLDQKRPDSCGPAGVLANLRGLPRPSGRDRLDPDLVAFVEALARYAARQDYEAQPELT